METTWKQARVRRRPKHEFENVPVGRFQWEQLVRRAELGPSTKYVAGWLATWASQDGGDLIVGEELLANALGRGERMVREHLAKLRKLGLIECLREAAPGRSAEYQLTFPGNHLPLIEMRLDVDNSRMTERPEGRMGERRPAKNTGTQESEPEVDDRNPGAASPEPGRTDTGTRVPVSEGDDRNPGSGDAEITGARVHEDRHPGAASPAPRRENTGTRVPPTNTEPEHHHPSPRGTASDLTLTSAQPEPESSKTMPVDIQTAYRRARVTLDAAPKATHDRALAQAAGELADLGIVDVRTVSVRAARILEGWAAHELAESGVPDDWEAPTRGSGTSWDDNDRDYDDGPQDSSDGAHDEYGWPR